MNMLNLKTFSGSDVAGVIHSTHRSGTRLSGTLGFRLLRRASAAPFTFAGRSGAPEPRLHPPRPARRAPAILERAEMPQDVSNRPLRMLLPNRRPAAAAGRQCAAVRQIFSHPESANRAERVVRA